MPLTYRSHVIGLLRGRRAGGGGGYSVVPGVPLKVWLIKRVFGFLPPESTSPYTASTMRHNDFPLTRAEDKCFGFFFDLQIIF